MRVHRGFIFSCSAGVVVLAVLAFAPDAHASCGAESCPLDNSAFGGRARRLSLEFSYQYTDQSRVRVAGSPGDLAPAYASGGEVRTISSISTTKVLCSLGPRWQVSASLPVVDRLHRHVTAGGLPVPELRTWEYSGVGDLTLMGNGSLFTTSSEAASLNLSILGGIKLPTGRRHVPAIDGEEPEPHARPGTGSTDLLAGVQVVQNLPLPALGEGTTVLFASALYDHTGRGVDGYRVGRMFEAHLGTSYPLFTRLRLLAQASSRASNKDRTEGVDPASGGHAGHAPLPTEEAEGGAHENTGGTAVFASPGVRFEASPWLAVSTYVQFPIYQRVNGTQLVAPSQFWIGTTYKLP